MSHPNNPHNSQSSFNPEIPCFSGILFTDRLITKWESIHFLRLCAHRIKNWQG